MSNPSRQHRKRSFSLVSVTDILQVQHCIDIIRDPGAHYPCTMDWIDLIKARKAAIERLRICIGKCSSPGTCAYHLNIGTRSPWTVKLSVIRPFVSWDDVTSLNLGCVAGDEVCWWCIRYIITSLNHMRALESLHSMRDCQNLPCQNEGFEDNYNRIETQGALVVRGDPDMEFQSSTEDGSDLVGTSGIRTPSIFSDPPEYIDLRCPKGE
ncbi:hypothetical protein [Vitis varicosavirus]|uniref:Uncharacterized protein n=1 Tax=Vitis varicosavirus TaxID=2812030 RepID=A0A830ZWZ1_9RHAB|nr:hypothetical protein QK885_sRNA2gp4 [Vitis varicosavirus]BCS90312.1 hypothetical protein [Vitis varicosavirus]